MGVTPRSILVRSPPRFMVWWLLQLSADELKVCGTLYGLESDQKEATTASNSLGVHVHGGTTCSEASAVGGHYYDAKDDPWSNIHYTSDADGGANFEFTITKA